MRIRNRVKTKDLLQGQGYTILSLLIGISITTIIRVDILVRQFELRLCANGTGKSMYTNVSRDRN